MTIGPCDRTVRVSTRRVTLPLASDGERQFAA